MLRTGAVGRVLRDGTTVGNGAPLSLKRLTRVNVYDFVQAITDLLKSKHLRLTVVGSVNLKTCTIIRRPAVDIHDQLRVKRTLNDKSFVGLYGRGRSKGKTLGIRFIRSPNPNRSTIRSASVAKIERPVTQSGLNIKSAIGNTNMPKLTIVLSISGLNNRRTTLCIVAGNG